MEIVKEQKCRIIELSSGRQDLLRELRDKTKLLQEESRTRCKIEERAIVTQEVIRLIAYIILPLLSLLIIIMFRITVVYQLS